MATNLEILQIKFEADIAGLTSALKSVEAKIEGVSNKFQKETARMGNAWAILAAGLAGREIVGAAIQMENLNARLLTMTGNADMANEAMNFIVDSAKAQHVEIAALADGYAKLLPAVNSGTISLDEMRQILTLTNDNIAALKLNGGQLQALFYGLSQVLGSGTVTMEDLRQVTDQLPGSFAALAAANGKSTQAFRDFVATGEVTAAMIKGDLIQALAANEGAAEKMGDTFTASMTDMKNAVMLLGEALKDAGLLKILTDIMTVISSGISGLTSFTNGATQLTFALKGMGEQLSSNAFDFLGLDKMAASGRKEVERLKEEILRLQDATKGKNIYASPAGPETEKMDEEETGKEKKAREKLEKKAQMEREALADELATFEESLRTKEESENFSYEARLEKLQEFKDQELITNAEYAALEMQETTRHWAELAAIEDDANEERKRKATDLEKFMAMSHANQAKTVFDELNNITAGVAQHNRALFEMNKISGIAGAIINAYVGISKTMAMYPFPLNIGMAAAHAAAAFAQVNAIRSTSFSGGGGSAPSIAGSTPATPVSDVGGGGGGSERGLRVSIAGVGASQMFSSEQVRALMSKMNDEIEDGAVLKGITVS